MSHPLTRHLTKAAFLLAAGAAPVLGAAGQAAAVAPLPSGLSNLVLDEAGVNRTVGDTVDNAALAATGATETMGGDAVKAAMPVVGPLAHGAAHETGTTAGALAGDLARTTHGTGLLPLVDQVGNGR
ncbi:ATP-binding protein [Streptomyces radicis]|uniref:ATP-binding protein n=1 Tax=Streptomyces radicis TaxID=1750517 RepID=A0A3A9W788_9ACTN|nr:ATP-binding protein [Streptomyces radicis]RKN09045.1 ATP-binding protein [Streptomyces radicis]RKN22764.1 ATP-binding protein [Streptomyces radicis]